ncbi:MAG TPA: hypothetical protein VG406_17165 [Isosphaeraceae bacterium]|jgi:hypothetical protein|nr:hypothetical protein [Isosphaeraceae bacterium]
MPGHLIRLRGAWERRDPAVPDAVPARVVLPLDRPLADAPFRLERRFGLPRPGPGESVRLRLEEVPGLVAVALNGQPLAQPAPGTTALTLEPGPALQRRNVLALDVDPSRWASPPETWGRVALEIGPEP